MNFGRMDRRVTMQTRQLTQDAAGGRVETWTDESACWAEMLSTRTAEKITGNAERAIGDLTFRIRYKSGIASHTHRLTYQGQTYDILGIDHEGRSNAFIITCRTAQSLHQT